MTTDVRDVIVNFRLSRRELAKLQQLERHARRSRANLLRWLIATAQVGGSDVTTNTGGKGNDVR